MQLAAVEFVGIGWRSHACACFVPNWGPWHFATSHLHVGSLNTVQGVKKSSKIKFHPKFSFQKALRLWMALMLSPHKKPKKKRCKQKDGALFTSLTVPYDRITLVRGQRPAPLDAATWALSPRGRKLSSGWGWLCRYGRSRPPPLQSHWKPLQWLLAQPLGFQAMIFMWGVSESFSVSPGHSDITCRLHLTFATHQKSEGLWICKLCRWANPTISWLLTSHQPIQPVAPQSAVAGANAARAPQKRSARPTWSRPKVRAHNDMLYYFILYHLISYIISSYIRLFI